MTYQSTLEHRALRDAGKHAEYLFAQKYRHVFRWLRDVARFGPFDGQLLQAGTWRTVDVKLKTGEHTYIDDRVWHKGAELYVWVNELGEPVAWARRHDMSEPMEFHWTRRGPVRLAVPSHSPDTLLTGVPA